MGTQGTAMAEPEQHRSSTVARRCCSHEAVLFRLRWDLSKQLACLQEPIKARADVPVVLPMI